MHSRLCQNCHWKSSKKRLLGLGVLTEVEQQRPVLFPAEMVLIIVTVSRVFARLSPLKISCSIFSYRNTAVGTHSEDTLQSTRHICDTYGRRLGFPSASTRFTSPVPNPLYEDFSFVAVRRVYKCPNRRCSSCCFFDPLWF